MRQLVRRMLSLAGLLAVVGSTFAAADSAAAPVTSKAAQTLVRSFDLTVSLEWTPGTSDKLEDDLLASGCPPSSGADSYVDDVIDGLREMSAYLYDISDGQMALRNVTIYPGAQNWGTADIRILATNATRPAAFPGGIVDVPTRYTNGVGGGSVFYPGTIYLGRSWDGNGSRCGRWSADAGSRTLGHEWGHYALYLWDEYVDQTTAQEKYCTNAGADPRGRGILTVNPAAGIAVYSMMAYQYTADELWHPNVPHTGSCTSTPQWTVHRAADWDSVRRFYALTKPAQFGAETPFEGSDAEAMFNPVVQWPASAPADTSAPARVNALASARLVGQSYMVRPVLGSNGQPLADRRPLKIIGQGEIAAEGGFTLPFWGATPSAFDRAAVIVQNWTTDADRTSFPANYLAATPLNPVAPNNVTPVANPWQPTVSISPTLTTQGSGSQRRSEVTGITVRVAECTGVNPPPMQFVLCPAGGNCGAPVNAPLVKGGRQWTFTFPYDGNIDPPASYGYVYVRVPSTGRETMSWYQLAGAVGPASIEGHAPLLDGSLNVDIQPGQVPPQNRDSVVMFSPAQTCRAGLPAGVRGIVSTPLNVQVSLANRAIPWGGVAGDPNLRVRISYNQELITRMGINEASLRVLRLVRTGGGVDTWQTVPVAGRSVALDWITIGARPFSRAGETFAIGYGPD